MHQWVEFVETAIKKKKKYKHYSTLSKLSPEPGHQSVLHALRLGGAGAAGDGGGLIEFRGLGPVSLLVFNALLFSGQTSSSAYLSN